MQRSATFTGPGMALSPAAQRRTVRPSTSSCLPASTCDQPSAAIAAANSSGCTEDKAVGVQGETLCCVVGTDIGQRFIRAARTHQGAGAGKRRQTLRAIWAGGDKAERVGGKIGGDGCVAHIHVVGPLALFVNHRIEVRHEMH